MTKTTSLTEAWKGEPSEYASLIIKPLASRIASGKPFGLLEAHGPTGIGKTHAFISQSGVIEFLHAHGIPVLFCCDRWSLLDEVDRKIGKNPSLRPVSVKSNAWHADEAHRMYNGNHGLTEKDKDGFAGLIAHYYGVPEDAKDIRKEIEIRLEAAHKEFERERIKKLDGLTDEEKGLKANELIRFLTFDKGRVPVVKDKAAAIEVLGRNAFYRCIFPACRWFLDPFGTVLIMTTHKLVMGFDIGPLNVSMASLSRVEATSMPFLDVKQGGRTAVILDEFEAQHKAMLDSVSKQVYIKDPMSFQSVLYGKARDEWIHRPGPLQKLATEFLESFPDFIPSHFIAGDNWEADGSAYTFRSGNVIRASGTLSVEKTSRSYIVHKRPRDKKSISVSEVIGDISHRNLFWLRYSARLQEGGNPEAARYLGDVFNRSSGETSTSHGQALGSPDKVLSVHATKSRASIRKEEEMTRTTANLFGYDFLGLTRRPTGGLFDNPDLDVKRYAMEVTPECLLADMASHRFVFGLSATSCLCRACNHFEVEWGKEFLGAREALATEDEASFHTGIGDLISEKTSGFSCRFGIVLRTTPINTNNWDGFFEDGDGKVQPHPRQRFMTVWDMVTLASRRGSGISDLSSYLAFTASYGHVERILKAHETFRDQGTRAAREGTCQSLGMDVTPIQPLKNNEEDKGWQKPAYLLTFKNPRMKPVLLFLLNAEVYSRSGDFQGRLDSLRDQAGQAGAELFVLTVYASSERGVNLVFSDGIEEFSEFNAVCLVDLPYFHFSNDPRDIRANLRILQKLMEGGVISRDRCETYAKMMIFGDMQGAVKKIQSVHSRSRDYLIASFSSAGQALGRGVRDWGKAPSKTFFISQELVAEPLKGVVEDLHVERCLPMLGPILNGLYEVLAGYAEKTGPHTRKRQRVNESIEAMLEYFAHECMERYRGGEGRFQNLPNAWIQMRRSLLLGDVLHEVPELYLKKKPGAKSGRVALIDWAYEECDPSWEEASQLGNFLKSLQDKKNTLGRTLRRHLRLEGVVVPVEHGGKAYRPREIVMRSLIKPAVSESLVMEALRGKGVDVRDFHDDRRLFELFDLFLPEVNIAVDVKFWSLNTTFMADEKSMLKESERRLEAIRGVLGDSAKLAYVLFFDTTTENREAPYVPGLDDNIPFKERAEKGGILVARMLNPGDFSITREFDTLCGWLTDQLAPCHKEQVFP